MKRGFTTIVIFLCFFASKAQTFAPVGASWHYSIKTPNYDTLSWLKISVVGEVTFQGKVAKQFNYSFGLGGAFPCPSDVDTTYMYKSNDSLFIYENGKWQMLVNFNASVGDTSDIVLFIPGPAGQAAFPTIKMRVDSLKLVTYNGRTLKSVYLTDRGSSFGYTFHNGWYTEVIGHEFAQIPWVNSSCSFSNKYTYGRRCYADSIVGAVQFNNFGCEDLTTSLGQSSLEEDHLSIYPNPSKGSLFVVSDQKLERIVVYTATGVLVSTYSTDVTLIELPIESGMYFIEVLFSSGKKSTKKVLKL